MRHVVVIYQRFLPYHRARLITLNRELTKNGDRMTAIEVAADDATYGFTQETTDELFDHVRLFSDSYHSHTASEVHGAVYRSLRELEPDIILAPATAFPEGMAAIYYAFRNRKRSVIMDTAWEHTDKRGYLTRLIKRYIHKLVDAALIPADSHTGYYESLGFPRERIFFGANSVDNDFFQEQSEYWQQNESKAPAPCRLFAPYFLCVSRLNPGKGLETLIEAYQIYKQRVETQPWGLIIVGDGSLRPRLNQLTHTIPEIHLVGACFGRELVAYYTFARFFVMPSDKDTWGLVINEAMACGLPVIVSRGCGAAQTLVSENATGWSFPAESARELSALLLKASSCPPEQYKAMQSASRSLIAEWSPIRFAESVYQILRLPPRKPDGLLSQWLVRIWRGRISIN